MNYLKSLLICLIGISVIFAFWVFSMGVGFRPFSHAGQFFLSLGLTATALLAMAVIERKFENWAILGYGLVAASVAGLITSLSALSVTWIGDARGGFWLGAGFAILGIIIVGACSACFGMAVKNLVFGLFRLDFVIVLISFMVGVSAFYSGISVLYGCFEYNAACGVCVLVGLTGNATLVAGPTFSGGEIIDHYGNVHYVSSRNADRSVTTTDGKRMRQMPDGNYKES